MGRGSGANRNRSVRVCDVDGLDVPFERERRAVGVVEGDGAAEADADVETIVGGEQSGCADRDDPGGDRVAVERDGDAQGAAGLGAMYVVSTTMRARPAGSLSLERICVRLTMNRLCS